MVGICIIVICMFDEELPQKMNSEFPRGLDGMSLDELAEYIQELQAEIVRVEENMRVKRASSDAANAFFKENQ